LKMTNIQGAQAPAKQQKWWEKNQNSSTKTVAEQSMSLQTPLPGALNRKFEHGPHCRKVCFQTLDKWSEAGRINVCLELWEKANEDPTFMSISRIIMVDESRIYGYDPETKQQSSQWKSPQSPRAE
jgi:hypothetical protein